MERSMPDEPQTPEEHDRMARELARKVMGMPYQKQQWPKKAIADATSPDASAPPRVAKPRPQAR
jgi:hypothetical protein